MSFKIGKARALDKRSTRSESIYLLRDISIFRKGKDARRACKNAALQATSWSSSLRKRAALTLLSAIC